MIKRIKPQVKTQEAVFVGETRLVQLPQKPYRVWTAIPPDEKPGLPLVMIHNVNGFLEDFMHDWLWSEGTKTLKYFSRVCESNCWIIVEYA